MNFFELDISYFRSNENLFVGLFHGILFSLPFSVPFFICLRYFLFDGIKIGMSALLGTVFGQVSFFALMCLGYRPLIQIWYTSEPLLAFLGMTLMFKLATDFYHQKIFFDGSAASIQTESGSFSSNPRFSFLFGQKIFQIFVFQFLLMFLNPVFPATTTRLLLSQEILEHFGLIYIIGFLFGSFLIFVGFFFVVNCFQFLLTSDLFNDLFKKARGLLSRTGVNNADQEIWSPSYSPFKGGILVNKLLTFCIIGSLLNGSIQYTWRLFTQYPIEFLSSGADYSVSSPLNQKNFNLFKVFQREFPSFDSNIRHREKNLPVERHVPIERINARRTLSGRPPLNEEQKSDAYLKYNSFFLNKIEQIFEDSKIQSRERLSSAFESSKGGRTYDEILQLQKLKERYETGTSLTQEFLASEKNPAKYNIEIPKLKNNTKGKPKFSYIRELFQQSVDSTKLKQLNTRKSLYIHDDLHIYNALFHDVLEVK